MPNSQLIPDVGVISEYQFLNTTTIRAIRRPDQTVWFVAVDVCRALGVNNVTMALQRLDEDEKMVLSGIESAWHRRGGAQLHNVISESGLYLLTVTSRKAEAQKFRRWITSEILPAIRQQGFYASPDWQNGRQQLAGLARSVVEYAQALGKSEIEEKAKGLMVTLATIESHNHGCGLS